MKKINKIIVAVIFMLLLLTCCTIVNAESTSFSGSRNLVVQIDESDIDSYVSGGREGFEYALRKTKPTWLEYEFKTEDKTITFTMQFTFENYSQYIERLTILLGYKPAILNDENTDSLVEGFQSIELINFIKNNLESEEMLLEGSIQDYFKVINSILQFGDKKYETTESIDTREKQDVILFSNVSITTKIENVSLYSRTIEVRLDNDNEDKLDEVKDRFKEIGEIEDSHNINRLTVTFTASTLEELSEKTMKALNVSTIITEKKEYQSEDMIKVTYEEKIDTEKLLTENGYISNSIECPDTYENIKKVDEESKVFVNNQIISLSNKEENMCFTYERPVSIENIKVSTKITLYGEMERKIILQIPLEYANYYKDILTEKIKGKLDKGMTLNIYDEGIMRCYSIEFKALTLNRIEEKTMKILGGKDRIDFDNKYIFFLKSRIEETCEPDTILEGIEQPSKLEFEYILPGSTSKINDGKVETTTYVVVPDDGKVDFTFTYNHYVLFGIVGFIILVVIIIVLVIVRKVKKRFHKDNEQGSDNTKKINQESKKDEPVENKENSKKKKDKENIPEENKNSKKKKDKAENNEGKVDGTKNKE